MLKQKYQWIGQFNTHTHIQFNMPDTIVVFEIHKGTVQHPYPVDLCSRDRDRKLVGNSIWRTLLEVRRLTQNNLLLIAALNFQNLDGLEEVTHTYTQSLSSLSIHCNFNYTILIALQVLVKIKKKKNLNRTLKLLSTILYHDHMKKNKFVKREFRFMFHSVNKYVR